MVMNRLRRLPPLDCLVYLDAVERHQSLSAAARELGVTQVAVSKRIRQLEAWLGQPVIARDGRGIRTTSAGGRLAARAAVSFDFLQQTVDELRQDPETPVRVACMTALATFWLQPRLRRFALSEEACAIELILSDEPRQLFADGIDLVFAYGGDAVAGQRGHELMPETLVPVLAAASQVDGFAVAESMTLLDFPRQGPDWIDWKVWSRHAKMNIEGRPRKLCATYAHSIGLALKGEGIALGSLPLLQHEIDAGRLRLLDGPLVNTGRSYRVITQDRKHEDPRITKLRDFLLRKHSPA